MKVGILTFPNSPSYGASLQMKALYTALNELGCDAEIINYRNTYMSNKKHVLYRNNSKIKNIAIAILDIPGKRKFKLLLFWSKGWQFRLLFYLWTRSK